MTKRPLGKHWLKTVRLPDFLELGWQMGLYFGQGYWGIFKFFGRPYIH